ncbi:FHA domain protein [Aspergillus clavatus NRRL 1]|uniref:FHA domain protein n=1 Tax=Aspergillus clavatus (strain ATCC 1007 / CBS 513.65 / DSM 816 / NCTC 3887 / NRRL 1 / QM 1276 / 107) TaxID=344612 RepID=A1CBU1_ASPCL|nr:FHA domain protein [Aspergillus clavatus NRRL 1]EAW13209.1 FHA domain protein [Aspergillus clavatus NRRL 1]
MSASTVSASTANFPSDSRSGPRRRLSQLRAYTQNHFSPHASSSTSSAPTQRSSRRHTFSSRVPWFSPSPTSPTSPEPSSLPSEGTSNPAPCPNTEQSTLARYSSAIFPQYRVADIDLSSRDRSSDSFRSTPSNDSGDQVSETMARPGASTATSDARNDTQPTSPAGSMNPTSGIPDGSDPTATGSSSSLQPKGKATIRFFPHQETSQSSKPSLNFIPVSRTLPSDSSVIRVGRYSERDGLHVPNPTEPSDAPVGFKSKVVSRKHCEFLYINGQWHIKDVGSSSGTFLNHMRLSQPNMVSRLYTIKDGDIVQLGIDFRGGEETIFRCVRIRIECNRSWQQQPNEFNKNTASLIKNLGKGDTADYSGCRECSICLGSVLRPYQCLFMAACAHVWHYKCISRLIHTPEYPMFQCPNCRAYTDLSAEVDDTNDYDTTERKESAPEPESQQTPAAESSSGSQPGRLEADRAVGDLSDSVVGGDHQQADTPTEEGLTNNIESMRIQDDGSSTSEPDVAQSPNSVSASLERAVTNVTSAPQMDLSDGVPGLQSLTQATNPLPIRQAQLRSDTPFRSESSDDNPLTPRNDSGPLAFDGRAGMS